MTPSSPCVALLESLVAALREAAPTLSEALPYPQRTGIADVVPGEAEGHGPGRCSLAVTVRAVGGVEKGYALSVAGGALAVRDGAAFEDRSRLATAPGERPAEADVRRLFDALTADLGLHFATAS